MTVIRESIENFGLPQDEIVEIIDEALTAGTFTYRFRNTVRNRNGTEIKTIVTPYLWPLLLSTQLFIEIKSINSSETSVAIKTQSQWFITGDIFDLYRRYIRRIFKTIRNHANSAA